ncbi:ATP-grasp domain-containing protein [Winogradskyella vincentii]|uniref:ATP-grasp domain-containing protein n=1 Tax=Winogradskyella vincentii TaxID=2877122 RepID=A0ABS7Y1U3_9FLAO|nr:ATP-grasp domain-containing protein [Winogradskyella vincentii]MCA0153209.1 ATP-grasp domain-containing protein [Winogradskyella vincentii]
MDEKLRDISVLIPDGEDNMLLNVVYSLSLQSNITIYVLSSSKNHYMKYSRFIEKFIFKEETDEREWVESINELVERYNIDLIIPVFEIGFRKLIKNKTFLRHKDKLCLLPSLENFDIARNKYSLYEHMESNNIPTPKGFISMDGNFNNSKKIDFPLIAKPVVGFNAGRGVKLISSQNDAVKYLEKNSYGCAILFQEHIVGFDVSCNVLCKNGDILFHTMQKRSSVTDKKNRSYQLGFNFINDEQLLNTIDNLMKSLDWSGVANIDCRFDINDKAFKIIEINPRFWVNTELSALYGVNFPYLYCLLCLNKDIKPLDSYNNSNFLSLKGLFIHLKHNPFRLIKLKYLWSCSPIRFVMKDPLTTINKFIWRMKNVLSQA